MRGATCATFHNTTQTPSSKTERARQLAEMPAKLPEKTPQSRKTSACWVMRCFAKSVNIMSTSSTQISAKATLELNPMKNTTNWH